MGLFLEKADRLEGITSCRDIVVDEYYCLSI